MNNKKQNQEQIERFVEMSNDLEHKELAPEQREPRDAEPAPKSVPPRTASSDTVVEITEILKSIFWDYSKNVHQISTQMSTVTAAMMCAAVSCVLEDRGFNAKEVFIEEMQKLLNGETLSASCGEAPAPAPKAAAKQDEPADEPVMPEVSPDGILHIPDVAAFQKLGEYGFRNDDSVVRVELPEGVTQLPGSFFYGCRKLEEVWIPDSCTEIGPYAFYGCEALQAVNLGEFSTLREIGEYAFAMCGSLQRFDVPAFTETLGTSVFRFCSSLAKIKFSKESMKLQSIGSHLLQNCTSLEKVRLPESIATIPTSMFYGCSKLKKVTAKGVDTIEDYAFYGNESLRTVRLHGKGSIAPQAFEGCDPDLEIETPDEADD